MGWPSSFARLSMHASLIRLWLIAPEANAQPNPARPIDANVRSGGDPFGGAHRMGLEPVGESVMARGTAGDSGNLCVEERGADARVFQDAVQIRPDHPSADHPIRRS